MMLASKKDGLILFECCVVLFLLAIIIGLSIGNFSFLQQHLVRIEAEKFTALCNYLQQYAMSTHQDCTLTCDVVHHKYHYFNTTINLPHGVEFGILPQAKGPPSHPVNLLQEPITFQHHQITFYANGTVQPGSIYFVDRTKKTMYALTTAVSPISYIRLYRYDRSWIALI